MASRLVSLFRIINSGRATAAAPNSYGAMLLWRRVFEGKGPSEEEENENETTDGADEPMQAYTDDQHHVNVGENTVRSEQAIQALREFRMEARGSRRVGINTNTGTGLFNVSSSQQIQERQRNEEDVIQRPNLEIPIGHSHVNIAQ
eukprot:229447_1